MKNTKFVTIDDKEFLENPFIKTLANILNTTPEKLFVTDEKSNEKIKRYNNVKECEDITQEVKNTIIDALGSFKEAIKICRKNGIDLTIYQEGDVFISLKWSICKLLSLLLPLKKATKIITLDWTNLDLNLAEKILNE